MKTKTQHDESTQKQSQPHPKTQQTIFDGKNLKGNSLEIADEEKFIFTNNKTTKNTDTIDDKKAEERKKQYETFNKYALDNRLQSIITKEQNDKPLGVSKGIISENGGLLSHLAIIAREREIPVIVNFSLSKSEIKIGDEITMDGSTGEVNLASKAL